MVINISYLLSTPIAAYVFLPVFYRLQSASVYKSVIISLLTASITFFVYAIHRFLLPASANTGKKASFSLPCNLPAFPQFFFTILILIIQIPGAEVWPHCSAAGLAGLHSADDALHGHCGVRPQPRSLSSHRPQLLRVCHLHR